MRDASKMGNRSGGPQPAGELPRWPERLRSLAIALSSETAAGRRERLLAALWPLVLAALTRYVRVHARGWGALDADGIHDIAAEKALDLLSKLDGQKWEPARWSPAQTAALLSKMARNGVIDHLRVQRRMRDADPRTLPEWKGQPVAVEATDQALEGHEFAEALRDCAGSLRARPRTAWFLRVFLEMSSKEIARHPDVDMDPAAVDMALSRCRRAIRACMRRKGFAPKDMPPGTFAILWEAFRLDPGSRGEP